jgi:Arc/MetJ-type ribon-helix-helix transcriptional regulator
MDDERITLRMGQDEVQIMDSYLAKHPELGTRSLFIRTAVREYINRDAGVSAAKVVPQDCNVDRDAYVEFHDGRGEIRVLLTKRQMDTMKNEIEELGLYLNAGELIRSWFAERYTTEGQRKIAAQDAYGRSDPKMFPQ